MRRNALDGKTSQCIPFFILRKFGTAKIKTDMLKKQISSGMKSGHTDQKLTQIICVSF